MRQMIGQILVFGGVVTLATIDGASDNIGWCIAYVAWWAALALSLRSSR